MPYIEETCVAGKTIEVNKYYSVRNHTKGERRAPKEDRTSEAQKRINQRKAGKQLRRLMNTNFKDGDYLVRLDFFREHFPRGSDEMQESIAGAIRKLRREFEKKESELKYIYVKEIGSRGSRHIHMMMSKCDIDILRRCWQHGGIHVDPLNSDGQYRKVAEYFIKYAAKTEETEGRLIGKRYYASRNLIKPSVKKRTISANKFKHNIKNINGFFLEKESIRYGISEATGYEFFSYTLIKAEQTKRGA